MPKYQTIYDLENKGLAHTITAISAEEAVKKHPHKWSRVPPPPEAAKPAPQADLADETETADDLTVLAGIGKAKAAKLNEAGVTTFKALVDADHTDARFEGIGTDDDWASWREQAEARIAAA